MDLQRTEPVLRQQIVKRIQGEKRFFGNQL